MTKRYDTILENRSQGFRAGGLVVKDGKLLVMHQIVKGEDFFTIPGGSWELSETLEQTCKREIKEEFGMEVKVNQLVFLLDTTTRIAFYFMCDYLGGEISLGGPEKSRMNKEEQYYVEWLDVKEVANINFIPTQAKEGILRFLATPNQPTFFLACKSNPLLKTIRRPRTGELGENITH